MRRPSSSQFASAFRFPTRGIDHAAPIDALRDGFCQYALNVRPQLQANPTFAGQDRLAGGKRGGLRTLYGLANPPATFSTRLNRIRVAQASGGITKVVVFGLDPTGSGTARIWIGQHTAVTLNQATNDTTAGVKGALVETAQLGNRVYAVDELGSRSYVDLDTQTVTGWTATNGSLPAASDMRLIAAYRARIVAAPREGSIFTCSRIGNGQDWAVSGTDFNSAYVGNASGPAGVPGDAIRALVARGDEYLLFMCRSSIWKMVGDPNYGGRIGLLDAKTGIWNSRSYCFDSEGNLFFVDQTGKLMMLPAGASSSPREVFNGRMAPYFERSLAANPGDLANLAFNSFRREVYTFMSSNAAPSPGRLHPIYCQTTKGGFLDRYPSDIVPLCAEGLDVSSGVVLLGGIGNFVYGLVEGAYRDEITTGNQSIPLAIRFAPWEPASGARVNAMSLEAVGAMGSGAATYYWLRGNSAEEVAALDYTNPANVAKTGTLFGSGGGYQQRIGLNITAPAHQLVIAQDSLSQDLRFNRFMTKWEYMDEQVGGL